jgi:hypothetical protein
METPIMELFRAAAHVVAGFDRACVAMLGCCGTTIEGSAPATVPGDAGAEVNEA